MEQILVYITAANDAEAKLLAETLVRERLAACANIVSGIKSIFHWQGKIESATEALCLFKSTAAHFEALNKRVLELHSYETPCVVAVPLADGNPDFLQWISASCASPCKLGKPDKPGKSEKPVKLVKQDA